MRDLAVVSIGRLDIELLVSLKHLRDARLIRSQEFSKANVVFTLNGHYREGNLGKINYSEFVNAFT